MHAWTPLQFADVDLTNIDKDNKPYIAKKYTLDAVDGAPSEAVFFVGRIVLVTKKGVWIKFEDGECKVELHRATYFHDWCFVAAADKPALTPLAQVDLWRHWPSATDSVCDSE